MWAMAAVPLRLQSAFASEKGHCALQLWLPARGGRLRASWDSMLLWEDICAVWYFALQGLPVSGIL